MFEHLHSLAHSFQGNWLKFPDLAHAPAPARFIPGFGSWSKRTFTRTQISEKRTVPS